MLSTEILKVLIAGALFVHGIAHAIALGAAFAQTIGGPSRSRVTLRSSILPALSPKISASIAFLFWAFSTISFLMAALSFWGTFALAIDWRNLATAGSIVSIVGVALFSGIWPGSPTIRRSMFNTFIALVMDLAILISLLWLHWPPQAMFGK